MASLRRLLSPSQPLPSCRLSIRAANLPRGVRAAAKGLASSDLGEIRSDPIRRRFIGTLTARVQVCRYRPFECGYRTPPNAPTRAGPVNWQQIAIPKCSNLHMRIALYEPDIPQNTGTILRLCACCGIEAHIIGPAGFPTSDRAFRRAGMDYLDAVTIVRHRSWLEFDGLAAGRAPSVGLVYDRSGCLLSRLQLYSRRCSAFRARIGRSAGRGPRRCGRARRDSRPAWLALAQCRDRGCYGRR